MLTAMHRTLSAALAGFALLALTCAPAGADDPGVSAEGGFDLATRLRAMGLAPQGDALQRGPYQIVYAVDARGRTLRVVADEELGEIISIAPVHGAWDQHARPHIIHVPEAPETETAVRTPPPPGPVSAPAPAPDRDPLTPVYPTPRFKTPEPKGF
jgi:hypothetical protein